MSRIGKNAVTIPAGVDVTVADGHVEITGRNGALRRSLASDVTVTVDDGAVSVAPAAQTRRARALWGTTRAAIQSMVDGVDKGFRRELEIQGVGYRAQLQGGSLRLQLGYSHDVVIPVPEGVAIECPSPTDIVVSGMDKQRVGQVASEIRGWRPPEPYKGKGVRYKNEYVLRKEGKKK